MASPLEVLNSIMEDKNVEVHLRIRAAELVLVYTTPRAE